MTSRAPDEEPGRRIEEALRSHPELADAAVLGDEPGVCRVIVVPREPAATADEERTRVWARLFDAHYEKGRAAADPEFDISSWNSSYTRAGMTEAEMREWTDATVRRILDLGPARAGGCSFLELGCGTGLLLHRLLPHASRYVGVDASSEAVRTIEEAVRRSGGNAASRVSVSQGDALAAARAAAGPFDVVVVNSVAQYFPSVEYLLELVGEALRVLAADGVLFLGDLRNVRLQRAFHISVLLARTAEGQDVANLRHHLAARLRNEHETLYDPELLHATGRMHPEVGAVVTALRRGSFDNEMNRFQFDAAMKKGAVRDLGPADRVRWDALPAELASPRSAAILATSVPNARVIRWALSEERLESADPHVPVASLVRAVDAEIHERPAAPDPEALARLGEERGFVASLDPGAAARPWGFGAAFLAPSASPDAKWLASSLLRRDAAPAIRRTELSNRVLAPPVPAGWRDGLLGWLSARSLAPDGQFEVVAAAPRTFRLLAQRDALNRRLQGDR